MNAQQMHSFQTVVLAYYHGNGRHELPWRQHIEPYAILVSELMLQQTQVARVLPKFQQFMGTFPTLESLAQASLAEVLDMWLGLGYNRRARFLHLAAQKISEDYGGIVPSDQPSLEALPGIGPNTAGAILAYAFNKSAIFIETNVRSVYIHHFFNDRSDVSDNEIKALLQQTIDTTNPREWYWALMDYGTYLKAAVGNNIQRSYHYKKQSKFEGSLRQLRGAVLQKLHTQALSFEVLSEQMADKRLPMVMAALQAEGFLEQSKEGLFCLTGSSRLP
ncbi:MAG TPA: hypothetical protein VFZ58_02740 [Candidatus Saccharimonadales bacterium]